MKAVYLILIILTAIIANFFPDSLKYLVGGWCSVGIYNLTQKDDESKP